MKDTSEGELGQVKPIDTTLRVVCFEGTREGPRLAIIGRAGDLTAVLSRLESEGEAERLAGQFEFYTPSNSEPDEDRCLMLPNDEAEGSMMSATKCYLAVMDRAVEMGMRDEMPSTPWQGAPSNTKPERRTGTGWTPRAAQLLAVLNVFSVLAQNMSRYQRGSGSI